MELVAQESAVTEQEKKDLEVYINDAVEVLKANHAEMNKFVMKSVSALSASKARSKELASQGFFGRLWGSITGKNRRMQNAINMSNTQAIYAVGQAVKKLAEQNAMSFELITAVNNKLNHAIVGINEEINELKSNLVVLFKQSRSEIAQLNQRVDALEKCADLERWHDTVEYLTFNDMNYEELPPIDALVCLTNDFYVKSHGEWTFSDLLLLKSTFKELDINLKEKISYKDFVDEIVARPELRDRLFEGIDIHSTVDYIPAYTLLDKKSKLAGEEKYICDTVAELSGKDSGEEISNYLVEQYAISNVGVDYNAGINIFDFSLELLAGLKGYEWQENEILDVLDEAEDVEVPALDVPKIDWEKYPFPQYRRIAVSEESTLMIDNDGVVHAWGANESINNVPDIDECCVSVGLFVPGWKVVGTRKGVQADYNKIAIAMAVGVSKKLYYWGDYIDEMAIELNNIPSVRWVSENGSIIVLEEGYCIHLEHQYVTSGTHRFDFVELPYNVKMILPIQYYDDGWKNCWCGVSTTDKMMIAPQDCDIYVQDMASKVFGECRYVTGNRYRVIIITDDKIFYSGKFSYKISYDGKYSGDYTDMHVYNGCYNISNIVYANDLLEVCGSIFFLKTDGRIDFFNAKQYADENYYDLFDELNRCSIQDIGEIKMARYIKDIVSVLKVRNRDARIGMVLMDKNCKVYYLGYFGEEELCKQGMPDEFKI